MKDIFQVIDTVQLSEKATLLTETNNEYVFKVDPRANKLEIKEAVEKLFGKKVESVRTANYNGKKKRERRADFGRTKNWKKAFVKLADGEAIEFV
ncbi:MAG: 50S ribosomal protein L23 [Verrucomicrobiales bacterium]|jgi:large subunit ribosomal protein L23|nr:50S ribosomal protein L23 [Verrucomicrobiales bacterium]MEC8826802.1 50S ribosomal protein L23 [Verrucomicrobiota bacterium]NRB75397.1 50S ribosomal protein L23 [Verrucomicrobiales bacterium]|tara:strand:+ start:31462 stop:31746 length:285 start_codon:yes stop_codon:yes gene_type:complete